MSYCCQPLHFHSKDFTLVLFVRLSKYFKWIWGKRRGEEDCGNHHCLGRTMSSSRWEKANLVHPNKQKQIYLITTTTIHRNETWLLTSIHTVIKWREPLGCIYSGQGKRKKSKTFTTFSIRIEGERCKLYSNSKFQVTNRFSLRNLR